MRSWTLGILLLGELCLLGCSNRTAESVPSASSTTSTVATASATNPAPAPQPVTVPSDATAEQVVTVFLNALRTGDSPTTESLLTAKAREELAKHELSVDVQSAPSATYQVQPAEVVPGNPNGAHVRSVWTEKYDDGVVEPYEIVWVLRRQPEGWRLAGMAMQLIPNQDLQLLNFEDPADMLRKKEQAMAILQAPAAQTAQQPPAASNQPPPVLER